MSSEGAFKVLPGTAILFVTLNYLESLGLQSREALKNLSFLHAPWEAFRPLWIFIANQVSFEEFPSSPFCANSLLLTRPPPCLTDHEASLSTLSGCQHLEADSSSWNQQVILSLCWLIPLHTGTAQEGRISHCHLIMSSSSQQSPQQ